MSISVLYDGIAIGEAFEVSIRRGRSRELDEFEAASGYVRVRNASRVFDPPFFGTPSYLLLETGDRLLLETGDRLLLEQGGTASGTYGTMTLGASIEVRDGAVTVFSGHVEDINYRWTVEGDAVATFVVGDGLSTLARTMFQTDVTFDDGELPGVRIAEILDRSDVAFPSGGTYRALSNGQARMIGNSVSAGSNVLQELQLISRSDHGRLYTDRTGKLIFKGRYDLPGAPTVDFKDDGTAFPFADVTVSFGSEFLAFQATVTRQVVRPDEPDFGVITPRPIFGQESPSLLDSAGTPRTATAGASPPALIGARGASQADLLLRNDAESEARSRYLVDRFSQVEAVVSELSVHLHGMSVSDRAIIAALDINNVVTLTWTPRGSGSTVTQTLAVEGVSYDWRVTTWTVVTLQLSQRPNTNYFTLDTSQLDSGEVLGF